MTIWLITGAVWLIVAFIFRVLDKGPRIWPLWLWILYTPLALPWGCLYVLLSEDEW